MIVNVYVKGSSIVYFKEDAWNIVFITDPCHDVKFTDPIDLIPRALGKNDRSRMIEFVSAGTAPAPKPVPDDLKEFFNLADLHGGAGNSNLRIDPDPNCDRQAIHMRLPYGRLIAGNTREDEYYVREIGSGKPEEATGKFPATEFTIQFEAADSAGLTMNIVDSVGKESRGYPLGSTDLNLSFDNYCERRMGYNDFIHVYDWVVDTGIAPRKFLAGTATAIFTDPDPANPCPKPPSENDFFPESIEGDCDPVLIDPPPGD